MVSGGYSHEELNRSEPIKLESVAPTVGLLVPGSSRTSLQQAPLMNPGPAIQHRYLTTLLRVLAPTPSIFVVFVSCHVLLLASFFVPGSSLIAFGFRKYEDVPRDDGEGDDHKQQHSTCPPLSTIHHSTTHVDNKKTDAARVPCDSYPIFVAMLFTPASGKGFVVLSGRDTVWVGRRCAKLHILTSERKFS